MSPISDNSPTRSASVDVLPVYDVLPEGLIDLPAAAVKYGLSRPKMVLWVKRGNLVCHGRLKGQRPRRRLSGRFDERELLQVGQCAHEQGWQTAEKSCPHLIDKADITAAILPPETTGGFFMVSAPPKPNVRSALAMEFDEVDCNTGMSAAHAIAEYVITQCLRKRFPDTAFGVIHQASVDLAYNIAFGQRHEQTLPVIAAQAAGAAFNMEQADLDQVALFLAHLPSQMREAQAS